MKRRVTNLSFLGLDEPDRLLETTVIVISAALMGACWLFMVIG